MKFYTLKKSISFVFAISLCALISTKSIQAETRAFKLEDCIRFALLHNTDLQQSKIQLLAAKSDLDSLMAQYDSSLDLSLGHTNSKNSGTNPIYGTKNNNTALEIDWAKKLNSSGNLKLSWDNTRTDSNSIFLTMNPTYDSDLTLSLTQPLWKNSLGTNDKATLRALNIGETIKQLTVKLTQDTIIHQIENAFYSLSFANEDLKMQKTSLMRTKKLHEINLRKLKDGLIEEVDIIATEAAISLREVSILKAESTLEDSKDNLRQIIGVTNDPSIDFDVNISTSDVISYFITEELILKKAIKNSPELLIQKNLIEIDDINLDIKENELNPSLNILSSFGLSGSDETIADSYNSIINTDNPTWYFGMNLSITRNNLLAKSMLDKIEQDRKQKLIQFDDIKRNIRNQCRSNARNMQIQRTYIEAAMKSVKLQKKKLFLEEAKFNQGRSSIQWILNYQDDLSVAETELYRAIIDYYKIVSNIHFITGEIYTK